MAPPTPPAPQSTLSYSDGTKEGIVVPASAPGWAVSASERIKAKRELQQKKQQQQNGSSSSSSSSSSPPTRYFSVIPPEGVTRVLLHSCCAPCSGAMVEEMCASERIEQVVVFFYNPNIHPRREYEIRKEENKVFCQELGIEFIDVDYDVDAWYTRMKGMEFDPERGHRCTECFDMRMERTALYAHEHGFHAIATTNSTSRWKDSDQVDDSGFRCASRYPNLQYWAHDWQSDEMTIRKYQISAQRQFYKQEYCGCSYSLRDSNEWRRANGIPKIQIGGDTAGLGNRYFSDPLVDAEEESQAVVDEFFAQAKDIAEAGPDRIERKKRLQVYLNRRKQQAEDGIVNGLNNW